MPVMNVRSGERMRPSQSLPAGEGNQRHSAFGSPLHEHDGIGADQRAFDVGVAVARAGPAGADAAEHRAGVAAHDAVVAFRRAELAGSFRLGFGEGVVGHGFAALQQGQFTRVLADLGSAG